MSELVLAFDGIQPPGFDLVFVAISSQIKDGIRTIDIKEAKTYLKFLNEPIVDEKSTVK